MRVGKGNKLRGEEEEGIESETERVDKKIEMMSWNINGWRGTERKKRKVGYIQSEVQGKQVAVLTETHIKDKEEAEEFERSVGGEREWIFGHAMGRNTGVTIMIKRRILKNGSEDVKMEVDAGGRWVICTIKNLVEEEVVIAGIYASTKGNERVPWMKKMEKRLEGKQGVKLIPGDYNFVMDTKLDKIGGNAKNGTVGREQQLSWIKKLGVTDIWRDRHPEKVGTTWKTRGRETAKTVRTRIDRWLVSQVLEDQGRIGEVKIDKTRTSDHDAVICQLRVKFHKKKRSFERISARVVEDEEFGKTVKTIFEEMQKGEGGDLLERHETFKER
jgi:exonuclease III